MTALKNPEMPVYNCFIWDGSLNKMFPYNIFVCLDEDYKYTMTNKNYAKIRPLPKTLKEAIDWCERSLSREYRARSEYEWVATGWPCAKNEEKIDIYRQAMMNIDIIAKMFMEHYIN